MTMYAVVMEGLWPNGKRSRLLFESPPWDGSVPAGFEKWREDEQEEYLRPFDSIERCQKWMGDDESTLKFELVGRRPLGWYIVSKEVPKWSVVSGSAVACDGVVAKEIDAVFNNVEDEARK